LNGLGSKEEEDKNAKALQEELEEHPIAG